ncbi:FAD-dependent oxidoreductase [Arthrobacter bambusae]|uniref:FAD-dependent oxidoreductase n=1 Tax=Arthrobacter bambusae TaxID=1338426 RepID=UPI0027850EAB|nr:FAD-dependent oxidoreductase [Arthrobacter bambusae]MDQ0241828.1 hypothetical protein [Arthrobacter bambusae]
MKAVIVGAGIAGLVAARQLGLAGWDVELLEKSAAARPDGYMMDFFGPGVEASERIGLYPRLAAVAYQVEAAEYVDPTGRPACSVDYDQFARLASWKVLSLLRPDMERAALAALKDVAPPRCGSATARRSPGCGGMMLGSGLPSMAPLARLPRTSSSAPMGSIPPCAPWGSEPKRNTCGPWVCVRPHSS